ncbi:MAG: hypothetical protein V7661_03165 [Sulfitobacter sp.]
MEPQLVIRDEILKLSEKRRYYLLTACGATIGYLTTQITPSTVYDGFIFALLSFAFLALSLIAGFVSIETTRKFLWNNAFIVHLQIEGEHLQDAQSIREANLQLMTPLTKRVDWIDKIQIITLSLGALFIPVWKIASCPSCVMAINELAEKVLQ